MILEVLNGKRRRGPDLESLREHTTKVAWIGALLDQLNGDCRLEPRASLVEQLATLYSEDPAIVDGDIKEEAKS